ncbi:MAG: DUF779 domain-containing protein [Sphingomonadaceae bacterium]
MLRAQRCQVHLRHRWEHTQLIIDVVDGNGGMFSLDNGTGKRFLTRSRLFTDEELALLSSPEVVRTIKP